MSKAPPRLRLCAALLFLCLLSAGAALAGPPQRVRDKERMPLPVADKVVIFAMDQVTWDDIESAYTPNIDRLAERGAVGVMNTATLTPRNPAEAHLALGAGSRGLVPPDAGAVPSNRSAGRLLPLRVPSIDTIKAHNKTYQYTVTPGLLASVLEKNDSCAALISYDDTGVLNSRSVPLRMLSLAFMNGDGIIPYASIGNVLPDPLPESDDAAAEYFSPVHDALTRCPVVGVYFGGTASAESRYVPLESDGEQGPEPAVLMALERADALVGAIIHELGMDSEKPPAAAILIVVPYNDIPARNPQAGLQPIEEKPQNSPVILSGPGIPRGVLTSDTTWHSGLVANIDAAPTALALLGLQIPEGMTGKPMAVLPHEKDPAGFVADINRRTRSVDRFRAPGQTVYAALHLVAAVLAALFIFMPGAARPAAPRMGLRLLALTLILFPAACLLLPAVTPPRVSVPVSFAITYGASLTASLLLTALFRNRPSALLAALAAPPTLVALDLVFGWGLNTANIFSFSLISGKRFYGLGNEGMGVMVGAAAMGAAVLISNTGWSARRASTVAAGLLLLTAVVVGFPRLGANSGGALTAVTAMMVLAVLARNGRFRLKHALFTGCALAACILVLVIVHKIPGASHPTHVTSAVNKTQTQGAGYLLDIFVRKLSIHRSVMRATAYPAVLAGVLLLLGWAWRRPGSRFRAMLGARPRIAAGAAACLAAAFAGYFFNDSGLPVMAIILGYASAPVCWFAADPPGSRNP